MTASVLFNSRSQCLAGNPEQRLCLKKPDMPISPSIAEFRVYRKYSLYTSTQEDINTQICDPEL